MTRKTTLTALALTLAAPALMGAEGDGCNSPAFNRDPAPDMQGSWALSYDDSLDVTVDIGGAVYEQSLGLEGGIISLNHEGMPFEFNLDCTREEIVCPSEAFPRTVDVVQRNETFPRRMFVQIPRQECDSPLVAPNPSECGQDTGNPDCEMVCMGELVTRTQRALRGDQQSRRPFRRAPRRGRRDERHQLRPARSVDGASRPLDERRPRDEHLGGRRADQRVGDHRAIRGMPLGRRSQRRRHPRGHCRRRHDHIHHRIHGPTGFDGVGLERRGALLARSTPIIVFVSPESDSGA